MCLEGVVATKLFVSNLSFHTTNEDLKRLFSQAGMVASANIIIRESHGTVPGFGFIAMSSHKEVQTAMEQFNGQ